MKQIQYFIHEFLDISNPAPANSRRLYNSRKHSSSFSELGELKRPRGILSRKSKDDMSASATTTSRSSGPFQFRRRQSAAPTASAANSSPPEGQSADVDSAELQELDFSKWRVSIPFYTTASGRCVGPILGALGESNITAAFEASMLPLMNLEQPDVSLFSASHQGYYTVIADREFNGKRISNKISRWVCWIIYLIFKQKSRVTFVHFSHSIRS